MPNFYNPDDRIKITLNMTIGELYTLTTAIETAYAHYQKSLREENLEKLKAMWAQGAQNCINLTDSIKNSKLEKAVKETEK